MMDIDQTRALKVFTETRERMRAIQESLNTDDLSAGRAVAAVIDLLDDAIVEELRAVRQADASDVPATEHPTQD